MGYDIALWGSLKFPEGGVEAWRKLAVDGKAWSDWSMWFENAEGSAPRAVAEHLAEWESFGEGSHFFAVKAAAAKVDVQAFFSQDVFVEKAQAIAALFRVAERAGATGKVTFAGVGTPLAYRLTLAKKGSTFEALDEDLESSADVLKVLGAAEKREKERKKAERERKKADKAAPAPDPGVAPKEDLGVAIWADLQMKDADALDLWKTFAIQPWGYNDWKKKDGRGWFTRYDKPEKLSNIEYLQALQRLTLQQRGRDFFRLKITGLTLEWRGHLEREAFLDRALFLASIFRSARNTASGGTLVLAAIPGPGGFRFRFDKPGSAGFEAFDEDVSDTEPMKQILADLARRDGKSAPEQTTSSSPDATPAVATPPVATPPVTTPAMEKPSPGAEGLPPEAAAAMEKIHAILQDAAPEALLAAPKAIDHCSIQVHGSPTRVEKTFRTRDAMLAGLRGTSGKTAPDDLPSLQRASLLLAGALDPQAAEPHLRAILLSSAPPLVRSSAAVALAGRASDATIDALFQALPEPGFFQGGIEYGVYVNGVRRGIEHALSKANRDDVGARALRLLTPAALEIKAGITGNFVDPAFEAQDKQDYVRTLLYILGASKYRPARPRLIEIFQSHPLTEIRQRAAEALLFSASPEEIRGAFDEEPESFFGRNVSIGVFNRIEVLACAARLLAHLERQAS